MAEIKSESVADFIPESVPDFPRNTHTAEPAEKARLQERVEVLREWITPKPTIPVST